MRLLILLFSTLCFSVQGQTMKFETNAIEHEDDQVQAVTTILNPAPEKLEDAFEKWIDKTYGVDLDGTKWLFFDRDLLTAKGVRIPEISNKKIDLYAKFSASSKESGRMDLYASYGYDNWITASTNPYEFMALYDIAEEFVAAYLPQYFKNKAASTEERMEEIRAKNDELDGEIQDNREEIAEMEAENDELMAKMRENREKIQKLQSQWKSQNQKMKKATKMSKNIKN